MELSGSAAHKRGLEDDLADAILVRRTGRPDRTGMIKAKHISNLFRRLVGQPTDAVWVHGTYGDKGKAAAVTPRRFCCLRAAFRDFSAAQAKGRY